jgi:hypothetical protein
VLGARRSSIETEFAAPCPGARLRALPVRVSGGLVDVAGV